MSISVCFVFGLRYISFYLSACEKIAIYLITFQPTARWAKNCRYDEIGGRREARFPRTPLATLDKLASKKDQEFPGKISLQLAIFPSVFDEKVCLISLKPFDRVSCHRKMEINRKIPRKLHWNGQGLQQVVEKGDKLSNFCDEIGGDGFLKEQGFVFLMERLQQRSSPFYSSPSILSFFSGKTSRTHFLNSLPCCSVPKRKYAK